MSIPLKVIVMRTKLLILVGCAAFGLAGCATPQGAPNDEYSTGFGEGIYATPQASPTVRPEVNNEQMLDPNSLTTSQSHPLSSPGPAPSATP